MIRGPCPGSDIDASPFGVPEVTEVELSRGGGARLNQKWRWCYCCCFPVAVWLLERGCSNLKLWRISLRRQQNCANLVQGLLLLRRRALGHRYTSVCRTANPGDPSMALGHPRSDKAKKASGQRSHSALINSQCKAKNYAEDPFQVFESRSRMGSTDMSRVPASLIASSVASSGETKVFNLFRSSTSALDNCMKSLI